MNIANALSYSRFLIIGIAWVFAFLGNNLFVGILLLLSGLTDFLDGFLARRLGIASEFGAKLDAWADQVVSISLIGFVFLLLQSVYLENKVIVLLSIVFYLVSLLLGYVVHKKNVALHLYSMKLAMLAVYLFFIHALIFGYSLIFLYIVGAIIIIASFEEMLVVLFRDPKVDTKSIFSK